MILPTARDDVNALNERRAETVPERPVPSASQRRDYRFLITALVVLTFLALAILPLLGRTSYSPDVWLRFPTSETTLRELDSAAKIFWGERLPKTALAALAGAGLALAGLALQTLFRNPEERAARPSARRSRSISPARSRLLDSRRRSSVCRNSFFVPD